MVKTGKLPRYRDPLKVWPMPSGRSAGSAPESIRLVLEDDGLRSFPDDALDFMPLQPPLSNNGVLARKGEPSRPTEPSFVEIFCHHA